MPTKNTAKASFSPNLALAIILPLLVLLFVFSHSCMDPAHFPKFLGMSLCVGGGFLLLFRKDKENVAQILMQPQALCMFALAVVTGFSISQSSLISEGLYEWLRYFQGLAIFVFWIIFFKGEKEYRNVLALAVGVFGLVAALMGIIELLNMPVLTHTELYELSATFAHKNIFAETLLLTLPFSAWGALTFSTWKRWLMLTSTLLCTLMVIFLLSRAAWLGLALGLGYALFMLLFSGISGISKSALRLVLASAILLGIAILGFVLFDKMEVLEKQFSSIFNVYHPANVERLHHWRNSWTMTLRHPFLGVGMGDWKQEVLYFSAENTSSAKGLVFFQRPHNDYLWIFSESGLLAGFLYIATFLFALFSTWRVMRKAADSDTKYWNIALAAGIVSYMVFSAFNFPKERIEEWTLLHLLLAAIVLERDSFFPIEKVFSVSLKPLYLGMTLLSVFMVYLGVEKWQADAHIRKAYEARNKGKWKVVLDEAESAETAWYQIDPVSSPVALYKGMALSALGKAKESCEEFERAQTFMPAHIHILNNIASCLNSKGNYRRAKRLFWRVTGLAPQYPDSRINLVAVYYNQKQYNKALAILAQDTTVQDSRYPTYRKAVAAAILDEMTKKVEEPIVRNELAAFLSIPNYYMRKYMQTRGKRYFQAQVLDEVLYSLKERKFITEQEHQALLEKYEVEKTRR